MRTIKVSRKSISTLHRFLREQVDDLREAAITSAAAPPPDCDTLSALVHEAFWASLTLEEGRPTRFALAWLEKPSDPTDQPTFEQPIPFTADKIRKLAPILLRRKSALVVARGAADELFLAGTSPSYANPLEIIGLGPGVLAVNLRGVRIAVLREGEFHFLPGGEPSEEIRKTLPRTLTPQAEVVTGIFLLAITRSMWRHGNGGTILLPCGPEAMARSLGLFEKQVKLTAPMARLSTQFELVTEAMGVRIENKRTEQESATDIRALAQSAIYGLPFLFLFSAVLGDWTSDYGYKNEYGDAQRGVRDSINWGVSSIAKLTAVDGAVLLDDSFRVLSFGAHIQGPRPDVTSAAAERLLKRSILSRDKTPVPCDPYPGTRHASAVRFVRGAGQAIAVVGSHDGDVTLLYPGEEEGDVVALTDLQFLFD